MLRETHCAVDGSASQLCVFLAEHDEKRGCPPNQKLEMVLVLDEQNKCFFLTFDLVGKMHV